jgi:ubiquinone/menaquinone biosynthesis C-methylase UbiE
MPIHSPFYDKALISEQVASGNHRSVIGGKWDEIGELQFRTLLRHGLKANHRLIDVGCGSLRGGIHFVRHLEPNNYYGIEYNESLLDAGYELEIVPQGLADRLPRANLIADAAFDFSRFNIQFDFALAFSLFTHLPLDLIRVCLERLAETVKPGGTFVATFFEANHSPTWQSIQQSDEITSNAGRDPYHQRFDDYLYLCQTLPWQASYVGEFGHPRGQRMIVFHRKGEGEGETIRHRIGTA